MFVGWFGVVCFIMCGVVGVWLFVVFGGCCWGG